MTRKRVAILISGRGSNMAALIAAARTDGYPAEIALVLSNRPEAAGLETDDHAIELICLGGFMRLFTPAFVQRWHSRMLNIHPSLLPAFPGLDPHGQALRAGVKISGATVHFVIPETDAGPIVAQAAVPVAEDDTAETLATRVLGVEHRIYPLALKLLAEGRIRVIEGRCVIDGVGLPQGNLVVPA